MNRETNVSVATLLRGAFGAGGKIFATVANRMFASEPPGTDLRRSRRPSPLPRKRFFAEGLSALMLVFAMSSCTTDSKLREADLDRLRSWYPGNYTNLAQVEKDMAEGVADVREPVNILIIPVAALAIGENVFYVQQTDAMYPQRILSQRIHRFEKGPDELTLIQTILTLKQPERWRGGEMQPDLFKGIRPDDVQAGPGCALAWTFMEQKFTATCPVVAEGQTPLRVELTIDELRLADLSFNGRVKAVPSRSADPLYRFERQ